LIQVSADGRALPDKVLQQLTKQLIYSHFHHVHKARGAELGGSYNELRRMYLFDSAGLLVCRQGYIPRLTSELQQLGYEVELQNLDPPKRADAYEMDWERLVRAFEFRPRQDECLAAIVGSDGGIIDAPTAFGKMYVIAMCCTLFLKAKIAVITKSTAVANSIRDLLTGYVPAPGRVGGAKNQPGRVTVYNADSMHKSPADEDILLVDEVHQLMTDNYITELSRFQRARMYGFTASKETRVDNAHKQMEGLFGPTIFYMSYQEAEQLRLTVPIVVQWLSTHSTYNPVHDISDPVERKRLGIWQNEARNAEIAKAGRQMLESGLQTLIIVETVEHAMWIRRYLPEFVMVYAEMAISDEDRAHFIHIGLLDPTEPRMSRQRLDQLKKQFEAGQLRGVIATGVWSTGVSFDQLQVIIRAEGTQGETASIQVPGRVCRTHVDKAVGLLIDFLDEFDPGFRDAACTRRRSYAKRGWQQLLPDGQAWTPRGRRAGSAEL
jgi:superfamily II DNA or RNA helicase